MSVINGGQKQLKRNASKCMGRKLDIATSISPVKILPWKKMCVFGNMAYSAFQLYRFDERICQRNNM